MNYLKKITFLFLFLNSFVITYSQSKEDVFQFATLQREFTAVVDGRSETISVLVITTPIKNWKPSVIGTNNDNAAYKAFKKFETNLIAEANLILGDRSYGLNNLRENDKDQIRFKPDSYSCNTISDCKLLIERHIRNYMQNYGKKEIIRLDSDILIPNY